MMAAADDQATHKVNLPFLDFIYNLNFQDYFPQKLTLQDSLVINSTIKPNASLGTNNPKHLIPLMLEQIKMSNYKFRNVFLYNDTRNAKESGPPSVDYDSDISEDDDELNLISIHPMDALLALIHCADNFLRQDIFSKLVSCQASIPILMPDPLSSDKIIFPLWAMRSIVKHWKTKSSDNLQCIPCEGRLIESETRMISFMRFSHPGNYSKSKILNGVISDCRQDFFFNYDCQGSNCNRKFVEGLVEACWYLPSGEKSDIFDDLIMFANLRGNASNDANSQQFDFLLANSFISFVFLLESDICPEQNLARFNKSKGKIFFLMPTCSRSKSSKLNQLIPNSAVLDLSRKLPPEIITSIRSRITSKMAKEKSPSCQLSQCLKMNDFNDIVIDENESTACLQGKLLAEEICQNIKGIESSCIKEKVLPLQGRSLWHKWAAHNKIQNRAKVEDTGDKKIQVFVKEQFDIKLAIRQEQCIKVKENMSFVMSHFTNVLLEYSEEIIAYFLQWLKFLLDDQSRFILPELQKACKNTREELCKKDISGDVRKQLQDKLKEQDIQLIDASFGVEHLFRELGQMYESVMEVGDDQEEKLKVKKLAEVVANLLLAGHPLEIVDGDAAHIPINWVQAVLNEVKARVTNSKIYTLSVLGIQSTGKSTLMNTMFGVRFSVSAGRCTRGAYLQLLKVQSNESKCNYLLIIDTEGLRAPELDSSQTQQHDNELAALVIGLADVTIVNMFGEVLAEISDILQLNVHAFLRMKRSEMQHTPSCQFVRHHVANVSSAKTSEGSDRFQETLNNMTKLAARREHYEGQFDQFSDVITFNNKTDVQNFPSLWEGNPPMAPVNPAYCDASQKLRNKFLQLATLPNSLCSLSDFQLRLTTLWNAVLKENFVFNFKNTLEVEAFTLLDQEYGEWSWKLHSHVIKWENGTSNFMKSVDIDNLDKIRDERISLIHEELDKKYEEIMVNVSLLFDNVQPMIATTMIKWKAEYEIKLQTLKEHHKSNVVHYCNSLLDQRKAGTKLDDMKVTERKRIDRELAKLVYENTDGTELTEANLEIIENKFNVYWEQWIKDIHTAHPLPVIYNVHDKIIYCLRAKCGLRMHEQLIVEKEKEKSIEKRGQVPLTLPVEEGRHLNFGKLKKLQKVFISSDDCQVAQRATAKFLTDIQSHFASLSDVPYEDHHIISVVRILLQNIESFDEKKEGYFTFTTEYRIDIILEVAGFALTYFSQTQDKLIAEHPASYLNSLRPIYKENFSKFCQETIVEKEVAKNLVRIIKNQMYREIKNELEYRLVSDVKSRQSHIFSSKDSLKGHVLLHLIRERSFSSYTTYLRNIWCSYRDYIDHVIRNNYWRSEKSRIISMARDTLKGKISRVNKMAQSIQQSNSLYASDGNEFDNWLTPISSITDISKKDLQLCTNDLEITTERIDMQLFVPEFTKVLEFAQSDEEELTGIYNRVSISSIVSRIVDDVAGCCELCVFCKEQCKNSYKNHSGDHECYIHRPMCLGGWRTDNEMTLETCSAGDGSFHPYAGNSYSVDYKNYRSVNSQYARWYISSTQYAPTNYWKWFIATYRWDLRSYDGYNVSNIPDDWFRLSESDARNDIKYYYHVSCCVFSMDCIVS